MCLRFCFRQANPKATVFYRGFVCGPFLKIIYYLICKILKILTKLLLVLSKNVKIFIKVFNGGCVLRFAPLYYYCCLIL